MSQSSSAGEPRAWSKLHTRMQQTVRNTVALVLLQNTSFYSATEAQTSDETHENNYVLGANPQHGIRATVAHNVSTAMVFVEELFAVRIPRFLVFSTIFLFGLILATIVPLIFRDILLRFRVARHYRTLVQIVLQIYIFVLSLWVALAAIGIDFVGIVLTFGVVSIVISAGMSGVVSNAFAGISLQTSGLIDYGHDIEITGQRGIVIAMSITSVTIRTTKENDEIIVVIPNSHFDSAAYKIHSRRGDSSTFTSSGALANTYPALSQQNYYKPSLSNTEQSGSDYADDVVGLTAMRANSLADKAHRNKAL